MQFWTNEECRAWAQGRGLCPGEWPSFEGIDSPIVSGKLGLTYATPFALSSIFSADTEVLLWVTLTKVWSANLHLYYRFREGYGDRRLVEEAPGHLFLHYEQSDFLSFIQIAIQSGWDFWAFGAENYARLYVSHDEYFEAACVDEDDRRRLLNLNVTVEK